MTRGAAIACVLVAAIAASRGARADEEAPPAAPALVPPKAEAVPDAPYPEGGVGDAVVIVDVVVSAAGEVEETRVIEGEEPFAAAAREALGGLRFVPARRGDLTVRARVRMRVAFTAPPPGPLPGGGGMVPGEDGAAADSRGGRAAAGGAATEAPTEVRVRGARAAPGQTSLGAGEIRQIPGAFGDAFRAIEALPGVTPLVSGLPFFFVRGAPPGNTGYYLDGVRVPLLYHLGFGPSVVHPALVERVDFFPGGYPARFGRFAGGILAGETRAPADRLHGEGNVRLFDAGALVETPLDGGRASMLVGGRYSYTAAALSLAAPDTRLAYWDYQARATYDLGPRDRASIFAFGSYDYLGERTKSGGVRDLFATQFHRVDLRYDHAIGDSGTLRLAGTLGVDASGNDTSDVGDRLAGLRLAFEQRLSASVRLRAGSDVQLDHYSLLQTKSGSDDVSADLYPPRDEVVLGAYADAVWHPTSRVEIVPGLRFDLFDAHRLDAARVRARGLPHTPTSSSNPTIDPRLAVRLALSRGVSWVSTFGVSHQPPSFFVPVPGLQISAITPDLQTSVQTSQGVSIALPAEVTLDATAFLHDYLNLTDVTTTCADDGSASLSNGCEDDRVRGRTYGVELLVKRALTKRLAGWLAYTLSRTTRQAQRGSARLVTEIPGDYDRTHVLNAVVAYDLGAGWRAGARFVYYTGRPYTPTTRSVPLPPYNQARLPDFHRIDVRLEKRWRLGARGSAAFVVEGLNVTLQKEAVGITCEPGRGARDVCTPDEIGPVSIPSVGVEVSY